MDDEQRRQLFEDALDGYEDGPDATVRATATALEASESARSLVLVEGVSDQIAVETLARRLGHDLAAEGIVVLPMGGAHGVGRYLERFGPHGADLRLAGLCDVGEEAIFRRAMKDAGIGNPTNRSEVEQFGFFVCDTDLEDELIRAATRPAIEALLDSQGDLGSFRTIQKQPGWRDRPFPSQMCRYLSAGRRRKSRYARLIIERLDTASVPSPLQNLIAHVTETHPTEEDPP